MTCRKCAASLPPDALYCHLCGTKQTAEKCRRSRANGAGTVYKRGNTYTAQLRVKYRGKYKSYTKGGFLRITDAQKYIPQLTAQEDNGARTLDHYWQLYRDNKMTKLSGSKSTAYTIAYNRLDDIAYLPIGEIGIKQLQDLINRKAPTYYPARDVKQLLSHLYKLALGDGKVKINLSTLVELPEKNEKESVPFTDDELAALWETYGAGDTFVGYILLMIHSGMMPGELMGCYKDGIDFDKQHIMGYGIKTKMRRETPIMLADFMLPVVRALVAYSTGPKLLTMNKDNFYAAYYEALERAGCRRLPPYSCRHTTGTKLDVDSNTPPSVIAKVLRQKSLAMQERYKHPDTEDALKAVNTLKRV